MKLLFTLFFLIVTTLICKAQKNYAVEVGAFERKVSLDYFFKLPEADVYEVFDVNEIYRYWIDCADKEAAEKLRQDVLTKGFVHARIIDFKAMEQACEASCGYSPPAVTNRRKEERAWTEKKTQDTKLRDQNYKIPSKEDFEKSAPKTTKLDLEKPNFFDEKKDKINCLFYDYKSPQLRNASKEELDKIAAVLLQNKDYTVKVYAHTDARGSDGYNLKLSEARAEIAHKYLEWRGVARHRISNGPYGERRPIALNELLDGLDSPEGRQLNRRVELVIYNSKGEEVDLVRPIKVPQNLRIQK